MMKRWNCFFLDNTLHLPVTRFPQNISKLRDSPGCHYSYRASATPFILTPVLQIAKNNFMTTYTKLEISAMEFGP